MASGKLIFVAAIAFGMVHNADATKTDGCTFTISSSGEIYCPAGQLDDGQIRLNGSYPTAEFTIMGERIWDSTGKGCIVTDAPVTQIQCDLDKEPAAGFSIDSSEVISYKGSSQFYACPATDTEYNIYVDPNFGQAKCFPVTLTASGCRAAPLPTSCPTNQPASTVWETCTVTEVATQTLTVTLTSTESCQPPSPTSWYNATTSKGCHKCTAGTGDSGWTTYTTKVL